MRNTSFAGERTKEDKAGWSSFLKHLKERGFTGVQLIVFEARNFTIALRYAGVARHSDWQQMECFVTWLIRFCRASTHVV